MTAPGSPQRPSAARRALRGLRRAPGEIRAAGSVRGWLMYFPGPGPWLMSWLRLRWTIFRNPHAHIEFRRPVYLGPGFSLHMPKGGSFVVGAGVEFRRNFRAELGPDARVTIGPETNITHDVVISCETTVEIGARCIIGNGVYIVDGNHRYRDAGVPIAHQGYDYRPLTIADDAMVLTKTTVVNDVGHHAVVGANSLVVKPIPAFCVAGGVPARLLDYFGPDGQAPPELDSRSASSTSTSG
jgi:acetyltransferase-like isoleucine patch superfamily enzyme